MKITRPLAKLTIGLSAILALAACADSGGGSGAESASTSSPAPTATQVASQAASKVNDPMARGAKLYKRCKSCHSLEQGGGNRVGPNLWNIYGKTAGTHPDFKYSKAMAESGIVWDDESMDGYLENPRKYLPGGKMAFAGLRKIEDRDAIQLYLKAQTGAE